MRRSESKEEIERKQRWASEGKAVTPKPEDISVILGRIRNKAEEIVERKVFCNERPMSQTLAESRMSDLDAAQRILELIEQAQKVVLEAQLSASVKAVSK